MELAVRARQRLMSIRESDDAQANVTDGDSPVTRKPHGPLLRAAVLELGECRHQLRFVERSAVK
jgi:hypothetical protein